MSKNQQNIDQLKFFAKISNNIGNYYIFIGIKYSCYQFPHKTFYYSNDKFQFNQLPQLQIQHKQFAQAYNTLFSGDLKKILVNLQGQGQQQQQPAPVQQQEQQGQQGKKPKNSLLQQQDQDVKNAPKKNFTQLDRLAHFVRALQHQAHIVPAGSYKMSVNHQLVPNSYFYGLNIQSAKLQTNYLHFRSPITNDARVKIQDQNVIFDNNTKFLDNLVQDKPKGLWAIHIDNDFDSVSVRNLQWPGYYAFHRLNSAIFGSIYIGDGVKNVDLAFML